MDKFALIIAPAVWQKLPLPGPASVLENLNKNDVKTFLFDMNIEIYNKLIKNPGEFKNSWTRDYKNFTQKFYDLIIQDHKEYFFHIISFIKNQKIKYAGFSIYKTNLLFSLNFAKLLKEHIPDIKIIFGGPQAAYLNFYNPAYLENKYISHFVIGEGENILLEILKNKIKDKIIHSPTIIKPDTLDFPKYREFNLSSYERKNSLPILSSRGCINKCSFCFERVLFKSFTVRDPLQVIEEIKYHITTNNIQWFTFYDSLFNGRLPFLAKFLELVQKNRLKFIWDAQIGIRKDMDDSLLQMMKKSGCVNLFIGLESGSEYVLKKMNKNFNIHEAELFLKKLTKNNINFEISLILNYPNESPHNFKETVRFLVKNKNRIKKIAQINPYIYYPGTKTDITKGYNFLEGIEKTKELITILDNENIKYTNAYINNLVV